MGRVVCRQIWNFLGRKGAKNMGAGWLQSQPVRKPGARISFRNSGGVFRSHIFCALPALEVHLPKPLPNSPSPFFLTTSPNKKISQMLPLPCHMLHNLILLQKTRPHHTIHPKFVPYMVHSLFHLLHLPRLFRFKQA